VAGVRVPRRIFGAFVISGSLAGLGGALWLAEFATVASTAGTGYEFVVIAAVVVGGVAIFGGSGTVFGAALGALLLNTIDQALVASRVSSFWNQAVAGFLLLVAIAFDRYISARAERLLRIRGAARG
jgi:rhamnose transport system permease protein